MRVMIGYDGSDSVRLAIAGLGRAGLPQAGAVTVVTAAEPPAGLIRGFASPRSIRELVTERLFAKTITYAREKSMRVSSRARRTAREGVQLAREALPMWKADTLILPGEPEEVLLAAAGEAMPDLLVVGTHGRSPIGRFFLGSVSQAVAEKSPCCVRIGRPEASGETPPHVIAGTVGTSGLDRLVRALGRRVWPERSRLEVLMIDDGETDGRLSSFYPYSRSIVEQGMEPLRLNTGLSISASMATGDVSSVLLERANDSSADTIMFAPDTVPQPELSGTVSALIAGAKCSIEIVR